MVSTRRDLPSLPTLDKQWQEVAPDLREYLKAIAQVFEDTAETAGDVGAAIGFFMGGQFAGASGAWGGAGAPITTEYLVGAADLTLVNERVVTNTTTITWDLTVVGQAKANVAALQDAQYLTLATNANLTAERVLTPDNSTIQGTDAGAGSTYTIKEKDTLRGTKALTDGVHTSLFEVAVPSGGYTAGRAHLAIQITNGTDFECASDILTYAAVNKGGTLTVIEQTVGGTSLVASTGAGISLAYSATTGTNKIIVRIRATSSLSSPTVLTCNWWAHDETGNAITAL